MLARRAKRGVANIHLCALCDPLRETCMALPAVVSRPDTRSWVLVLKPHAPAANERASEPTRAERGFWGPRERACKESEWRSPSE